MDKELHDTESCLVEAIGEPGQRRFRLLTLVEGNTTIAWMEKQQLDVLGRALSQVLENVPEQPLDEISLAPGEFDLETRNQFRVGRIELGYDPERDRLVLVIHDLEASENDSAAAFTALLSRGQAREIAESAVEVVAAGRPRCVLCGEAMGPGPHACVEQNGHMPDELSGVGIEEI